jgi:multiple sugar transport system ATP-binding protein
MGDRVAVLKDGILLQVDSPNDLFEYPETVFVGEFIGSPKMNVVSGTLKMTDGRAYVDCLDSRTELPIELARRLDPDAKNGPVLVGIRPHDLHLVGESQNEGEVVHGRIDISEHTGTEVFATIDHGEQKLIARLPRSPLPVQGDAVSLAFNKDRLYLFDVTSQQSLLRRTPEREKVNVELGANSSK